MEFACGFVYVPPSASQKDSPRGNVNLVKRSALLPPVGRWVRPQTPPPPPPLNPAEARSAKSPLSRNTEGLNKNMETNSANAEVHSKLAAGFPVSTTQPTAPRKTALLPPHMKPAANNEPDSNEQNWNPDWSCSMAHGRVVHVKLESGSAQITAPPLPPKPSFMGPEYLTVLPASISSPQSSQKSLSEQTDPPSPTSKGSADKAILPGNPNVVLVSLGKILSEQKVQTTKGKPTSCTQCGSVLDSAYDNMVNTCYFCQDLDNHPSLPQEPPAGYHDNLFLLNPDEKPLSAEALLLFCIDVSGSMSMTFQVTEKQGVVHRSRLHFVQEAVFQCVQRLSDQRPDTKVALITFNDQVTVHGYGSFPSRCLRGAELTDREYLKAVAGRFSSPPPLSQTKDDLQRQVMGLSESGTTALGPAALLAIAAASRQPGSKVIICTDGKANTELGNLEVEDNDARTLLSSTIFYQELGDYAANEGVTVSVLSIEGTDCRLDELGRLADRTGGTVVVTSPNKLHHEFDQIIDNRTIATHCTVTLLLPRSLRMKGEREAGHKGSRDVGNVDPDTEITFQFEHNMQVAAPAPGSHVSIQLQVRYRQRNGQTMLRVISSERTVTDDGATVLSSLLLAIIQLNSSQASAALAVRGRFLDARREGELQRQLIERAIEHNRSVDDKHTYQQWVKTMEPIYKNIFHFTRVGCCIFIRSSNLSHPEQICFFFLPEDIGCFRLTAPDGRRCSTSLHHEALQQEVHITEE
ncbi:circularly permutated Ras protein 1-like isoform X1 [Takifugu flavidus]|uniref:circularly permutated Ras protein 1-like isoform X1 n=1 Tax=Takifugu flavidus TaxID=433684 RepID=UPI0025440ACF|nr:circularly permutated Ras protein 1-like isoform X1 [Takifugu flavidus]XP_056890015.1 circularly permutated Ras protein 1-like isoform X1 [Takifugu flavidus]